MPTPRRTLSWFYLLLIQVLPLSTPSFPEGLQHSLYRRGEARRVLLPTYLRSYKAERGAEMAEGGGVRPEVLGHLLLGQQKGVCEGGPPGPQAPDEGDPPAALEPAPGLISGCWFWKPDLVFQQGAVASGSETCGDDK